MKEDRSSCDWGVSREYENRNGEKWKLWNEYVQKVYHVVKRVRKSDESAYKDCVEVNWRLAFVMNQSISILHVYFLEQRGCFVFEEYGLNGCWWDRVEQLEGTDWLEESVRVCVGAVKHWESDVTYDKTSRWTAEPSGKVQGWNWGPDYSHSMPNRFGILDNYIAM